MKGPKTTAIKAARPTPSWAMHWYVYSPGLDELEATNLYRVSNGNQTWEKWETRAQPCLLPSGEAPRPRPPSTKKAIQQYWG
jgi:hypothetical protein